MQNGMDHILSQFPNIKLCYETIIHNKVSQYDFCLAIPFGAKCFAWFHMFEGNVTCHILFLNEKKKIIKIKRFAACFNDSLNGTILYGSIYQSNDNFFFIENIYYYKGKELGNLNWYNKLLHINEMLSTNLKQVSYNQQFITFGLPCMKVGLEDLLIQIDSLKYKVHNIEFRVHAKCNAVQKIRIQELVNIYKFNDTYENDKIKGKYENMVDNKIEDNIERDNDNNKIYKHDNRLNDKHEKYKYNRDLIFKVKPDIQNDLYYLFCSKDGEYIEYDYACIPDYKTSVFMNGLFRNIKENINLDALEESDDEEEFENENANKFVNLDKSYNMVCSHNRKFNKWVPIKIAHDKNKVVNYKDLTNLKQNHK